MYCGVGRGGFEKMGEVIKVRHYKAGYEIRYERIEGEEEGEEDGD